MLKCITFENFLHILALPLLRILKNGKHEAAFQELNCHQTCIFADTDNQIQIIRTCVLPAATSGENQFPTAWKEIQGITIGGICYLQIFKTWLDVI